MQLGHHLMAKMKNCVSVIEQHAAVFVKRQASCFAFKDGFFDEVFELAHSKRELILTFLAFLELVKDASSGESNAPLTSALLKTANEKGLILLSCGTYANVIRFLVPLTASDALVQEGMDIFAESLVEAMSRAS